MTPDLFTSEAPFLGGKKWTNARVVETPFNTEHWESLKKAQLEHGVAVDKH